MAHHASSPPLPLAWLYVAVTSFHLGLFGNELLQPGPQGDFYSILPMGPIVHKDEVRVVAVQAREAALVLLIQYILSWKASLRGTEGETLGKA